MKKVIDTILLFAIFASLALLTLIVLQIRKDQRIQGQSIENISSTLEQWGLNE